MAGIFPYSSLLGEGLLMTVLVTVLGASLALITAFTLGLARISRFRAVRIVGTVFVEVFRGTSLLVLMFWFFFALPFLGIELVPLAAGVLALGLNEGAYAAEIVRSTIQTRPKGQTEACTALGLSPRHSLWRILLPQSVPSMLPGFGNVLIDLLKNTSLVSLVTIADLTFRAQMVRATTGETTAVFLTILVLYFLLSVLTGMLMKFLERRFALTRTVPKRRMHVLAETKLKGVSA